MNPDFTSFSVVVRDDIGERINARPDRSEIRTNISEGTLTSFKNIFKEIIYGIGVIRNRKYDNFDDFTRIKRTKEFETRIKRKNYELKQKILAIKPSRSGDLPFGQALRIAKNTLICYRQFLRYSEGQICPDGILDTLKHVRSLFSMVEGGVSLLNDIDELKKTLSQENVDGKPKDEAKNSSHESIDTKTKDMIEKLARMKFGNKEKKKIMAPKGNQLLKDRIQRSKVIRYGSERNFEARNPEPTTMQPTYDVCLSSKENSVKKLLSRIESLESGIENIIVRSSSMSLSPKREKIKELPDDSFKEITTRQPATTYDDLFRVERLIERVLKGIISDLAEEMVSPTLIYDILRKELI